MNPDARGESAATRLTGRGPAKEITYGWSDSEPTAADSYLAGAIVRHTSRYVAKGARVLDIGCGNGSLTAEVAAAGYAVRGIDGSLDGLVHARARWSQLDLQQHDLRDPLPDAWRASMDLVYSVEVVEHLYNPASLFAAANFVLQPGGVFIVTTPYHGYLKNLALAVSNKWDSHHTVLWHGGHIKFFSRSTLDRLASAGGFTSIGFEGLGACPISGNQCSLCIAVNRQLTPTIWPVRGASPFESTTGSGLPASAD